MSKLFEQQLSKSIQVEVQNGTNQAFYKFDLVEQISFKVFMKFLKVIETKPGIFLGNF